MSSEASSDPEYIQFKKRLHTLRYQHAVVFGGQQLLHLIMRTLLIGDINDIQGCLREKLGSKNQYNNCFTKNEQKLLENADHKKWDITLIFKVVQRVCGLDPIGSSSWSQSSGDVDEPLEFLITTLKECRNRQVHQFDLVLDHTQLTQHLDMLIELALKITQSLNDRAIELGRQVSTADSDKIVQLLSKIVEDVKGEINESSSVVPSSSTYARTHSDKYEMNKLESDSLAESREQVAQREVLKKKIEEFERKFWFYAGPKENEV